ncbi:14146_t:CDS:2 [Funneliformis geosporum]|uniref:14146_t:CDS:1 n=1 Tax=Funneliformis geosporum TaxID=1117311 RepID=A0A9W4SFU6_9GLOM|nr:14146_t:CDS:2 [Funneliformis geosporum]
MNSIKGILDESKSVIAETCLIWAIKPERDHEKTDLLKFLIDRIDQPEKALKNALDHYKVGLRFDFKSIKTTKEVRSLTVHSNLYYWILKSFGPSSEITQLCFDDIVESRTWIDIKLQEIPQREVPVRLTTRAFNSICSIYLEFCNDKVPFKPSYLPYLQLVNQNEIIEPLFGVCLPMIFGLQLKGRFPFEITYDYKRPEVIVQNFKRKFNVMNDNQQSTYEKKSWYDLLKEYEKLILGNEFEFTERFKNNFEIFWKRKPFIDDDQINDEGDTDKTSNELLKSSVARQM